MTSVTVKEREREWDTESVRSHRPFTTIRRYKIPEDEIDVEDTRVTITDRHDHRGSVRGSDDRIQYRIVERERERGFSPPRSTRGVEEDRIVIRHRSRSRSSSPATRVSSHHHHHHHHPESPYSLEKYSKSTEYFSQPAPQPIIIQERAAPAPQPIIIRESVQQPQQIVIRERERVQEPSYELVERQRPRERENEEDYYYERRVREVDRHREYDNEREWRRRRDEERGGYHSDDEAVYIRREYDEYGDRDESPHHKRHIAEGVIAGIAASQVVRHHRKREGRSPGSRAGQVIGYGALGGIGAEALTRWNRSRSRGPRDRYRDEDDVYRGRERSRSLPRARTIAGVAALAGLGALAYAAGKKNNKNGASRSRSRSRRGRSRSRSSVRSVSSDGKHISKDHRNRRTAQAGLVGAAAAGIAEVVRSRSRGGRSRSKSRVRQGVPIVAAGLGSAAVAGLYERHKGKKEAKEARELSRSRSRSYSRSRSRSRSRSVSRHHASRRAAGDVGLVEYGGDPIPSSSELDRPRSHSRGRHHRHRSASAGSSPDRRRSSSRGNLAGMAAAAGVAGVAAHEVSKRRERRKERERRQREEEAAAAAGVTDPYASTADLNQQPYYPASNEFAPPPGLQQAPPNGYLPPAHPNHSYADSAYGTASIPAYNPASYGPTTGPTLPRDDPYNREYQAPNPNNYANPDPYAPNAYAPRNNDPRNPENVSAPRAAHTSSGPDGLDGHGNIERERGYFSSGDVSPKTLTPGTPRARSPVSAPASPLHGAARSVQFNDDPVESEHIITPLESLEARRHSSSSHRRSHHERDSDAGSNAYSKRKRRRRSRESSHEREGDSDATEDLPPRFDAQGRRLPERGEDPIADKVEDLLQSSFFQNVADNFLGAGGHSNGRRR